MHISLGLSTICFNMQQEVPPEEELLHLNAFKKLLLDLLKLDKNAIETKLKNDYPDELYAVNIENSMESVEMICQSARMLLLNRDKITSANGWIRNFKTIKSAFTTFNTPNLEVTVKSAQLSVISSTLSALNAKLPPAQSNSDSDFARFLTFSL